MLRLECLWFDVPGSNGRLDFTLINAGEAALEGFVLTYTSLTRIADPGGVEGGRMLSRTANNHRIAPPEGMPLAPGESWRFSVHALTRKASHRTDGASTAFVSLPDGRHIDVACGDILPGDRAADAPGVLIPEGRVETPLALIPWPNTVAVGAFAPAPVAMHPGEGTPLAPLATVAALAERLFPGELPPFVLVAAPGSRALILRTGDVPAEGFRLDFAADAVTLIHAGQAGRLYGLIALAQMLRGARIRPATFAFPAEGHIEDRPRHGWRGCHLDVSRQIYPIASVRRMIDILAWNRLNRFHWHLTDDEGWRLEIDAFPALTRAGAAQGPGTAMPAQLGTGAAGTRGFYSKSEVRDVIARAAALRIEVVPEIDIPGHCTAALTALPHLVDPDEPPESYHSIQGYANNALNPGMDETFAFLDTVLAEMADLFPSDVLHIGGDEVAPGSWLASPRARALMTGNGPATTAELQAYLLGRVQRTIRRLGKRLGGWDEVSHGGGVDPAGTVLMAWQKPELGIELARQGYDVVMCPGQAYYLDMVQDDAWLEPGTSWAGTVSPRHTYEYEATGDFPPELRHRLMGVQACIWSENLTSRERFNHMVFPRLSAVAEAAWTEPAHKDWLRFATLSRLMPVL